MQNCTNSTPSVSFWSDHGIILAPLGCAGFCESRWHGHNRYIDAARYRHMRICRHTFRGSRHILQGAKIEAKQKEEPWLLPLSALPQFWPLCGMAGTLWDELGVNPWGSAVCPCRPVSRSLFFSYESRAETKPTEPQKLQKKNIEN